MIIVELARLTSAEVMENYSPFVYSMLPGARTTASYWTTTFGATGDDSALIVTIQSVYENPSTFYLKTDSIAATEATERSFYWDNASQTLYLHIDHNTPPNEALFSIGTASGYSDTDVVTIGSAQYDPLVRSVPNITQRADLVNYDRLAFISGQITFDNTGGDFDQFIDSPIYGNDVAVFYLPSGRSEYERSELVPLAYFFVEDYNFSLSQFVVSVQDQRKAGNAKVLSIKTVQGADIPLIYGQVRTAKAFVTDAEGATGSVNYRVAETLTVLGTVQVFKADQWTTVTPTATNLATGSFTLSAANGRSDGTATGNPLQARVLSPTGIAITRISDIIIDLNDRLLGITYDPSFYDTVEWEQEQTALETAGVVFDQPIELFEAIRLLQNGANVGFRYEIKPDGKRTIRIDDWERTSFILRPWADEDGSFISTEDDEIIYLGVERSTITPVDIKDDKTLTVTTDSSTLAASVTVAYNKDFNANTYLRTTNTAYEQGAFEKYRQKPNIEFETYLTTLTLANARASWSASRLSDIRGVASIELHGQEYYDLRIYDMLDIDFGSTDRAYFGHWRAQVISIAPNLNGLSNKIEAVLIERVV